MAARGFNRKNNKADEIPAEVITSEENPVENVAPETTSEIVNENPTEENVMSEENVTPVEEISETVEESKPAFDLDSVADISSGDEDFDDIFNPIIARVIKRMKKMEVLAKELSASSSTGDDTDIIVYAEKEEAPHHIKLMLQNFQEQMAAFEKARADLRVAVLSDQGISVLTPDQEEEKKAEFAQLREKTVHGLDGAEGVVQSEFDSDVPEQITTLFVNLRSALPILPGQRKVLKKGGATKKSGSHGKPRLSGGYVKVGDKQEDSFAPATRVINANLKQGETKAEVNDLIGAWISAAAGAGKTWQDVPAGTVSFEFKGQTVEVRKN